MRERQEDISLLAKEFLERFSRKNGKMIKDFSGEVYRAFLDYGWPGNIRELENAVERAVVVAKGNIISEEDLPARVRAHPSGGALQTGFSLDENEKALVMKVLSQHEGNISKAAKELGISHSTLYSKLRKYDL